MKIKIPRKLKLGVYPFTVLLVRELVFKENLVGRVQHRDLKIEIEQALNKYQRTQTFIHEVLHQVDRQYALNLSEPDIDRLAEGMSTFLSALDIEFDWSLIKEVK